MKLSFRLPSARVAGICLLIGTASLLQAKDSALNYLPANKPEAASILPPPPFTDSAEQNADLDTVRRVSRAATPVEAAAAMSEKKFSVFNFTPAVGTYFVEANLPKTAAFFEKVQSDAAIVTDTGKDHFKRPRPYVIDRTLANGKLETSYSYPSGHSTESMVLALVLADLVPDKHDEIILHARQMGWHRVQIGRHYPTDIYAGRVLAQAIVKQLKKSDQFEADFNAAKAEIIAAQTAAKN